MGLDNGITVKNLSAKDKMKYRIISVDEDDKYMSDHICYWRKCWNIRDIITSILHMKRDEHKRKLDIEDIPAIIRGIYNIATNKEDWDNNSSIWEYSEMKDILLRDILNLDRLINYMKDNSNAIVEFYDSF